MNNFIEKYNRRLLYKYLDLKNMVEGFDIIVGDTIFDNMYVREIIKISWD